MGQLMCFGENGRDTLDQAEQLALRAAASRALPGYAFSIHENVDAITWAVLTADPADEHLPRFTICRLEPCLVVMVEDCAERRFASAATAEEAISVAEQAAARAELARRNVHAAPNSIQ